MNCRFMQRLPLLFCALFLASCAGTTGPSPIPASAQAATRMHGADASFKSVFSFNGADGKEPYASLIAADGALYGTTYGGGAHASGRSSKSRRPARKACCIASKMEWTVRSRNRACSTSGERSTVRRSRAGAQAKRAWSSRPRALAGRASFIGSPAATTAPARMRGSLQIDGVLYGTTAAGGTHSEGTVFKVTTSGKESVLYNFGSANGDGATPVQG